MILFTYKKNKHIGNNYFRLHKVYFSIYTKIVTLMEERSVIQETRRDFAKFLIKNDNNILNQIWASITYTKLV